MMTNQPNTPPAPQAKPPAKAHKSRLEVSFVDTRGHEFSLTMETDSVAEAFGLWAQISAHLEKIGAKPKPAPVPPVAIPVAAATQNGAGDAPHCKYHGGPMKPGKGGKWFCPKRINGGAYCDYTVE